MTDVRSFSTLEEMHAWMEEQERLANDGLHPLQRDLTWGSHWIRFNGTAIEFGYCYTEDEARAEYEPLIEGEKDCESPDQYIASLTETLGRGYLYGEAHSVLGDEKGDTHRANAWPIEERLYRMAQEVEWNPDMLDELGRVLVRIAWAGWRSHAYALAVKAMRSRGRA